MLTFLLPTECLGCSRLLGARQLAGACWHCWSRLRPIRRACPSCGEPTIDGTDLPGPQREPCAWCRAAPLPFSRIRAAVCYEGVARAMLLAAKLGDRPELWCPLARDLLACVRADSELCRADFVVPVPSHPWVNLRRGFEPARLLAGPVARGLAIRSRRLLIRGIGAPRAIKRRRAGARRRLAGSGLHCRAELRGERVLLIDDVMTTGATLAACARSLRSAGAGEVLAAVWARRNRVESGSGPSGCFTAGIRL